MDSITAMATARATEKIEQQRTTEMLETLVSKHAAVFRGSPWWSNG